MHHHFPIWSRPLCYDGDFRRLEAWLNSHRANGTRTAIIITTVPAESIPRYVLRSTSTGYATTYTVET